ncbi:MAG: cysteine--tRNA ligase [Nitrospira sp.]|nr:cysteine--tRNA ligase [Nitrospira sp.]
MKIFNTLTNQEEPFVPITPPRVGIYVCGVTVYDECHVGHARSAIVFDVLRRYLGYQGYDVTYVKNFTDVDDKIINRAAEEGIPWDGVVEKYMQAYVRDMKRLGVGTPDVEPRATEHMPEILQMIGTLQEKSFAYQVDGDVYYRVSAFPEYGRLSQRHLDDMQAGARVEVDERKQDPMDFALWKAAKPGEPAWESPWGPGRPGWHIECSAMSVRHLGETFDIHGGGKDLTFPHHENEIAQSRAATGQAFARYWVHNGFVTIDEEKMSKSLGNFFTVRDIFDQSNCPEPVTAEAIRYFLLSTHYRGDVNFSNTAVAEAKSALDNVYDLFSRLSEKPGTDTDSRISLGQALTHFQESFEEAMDDDLNTPAALAAFQQLRAAANQALQGGLSGKGRQEIREIFRQCGAPLGLFQLNENEWVFRELDFGLEQSRMRAEQECTDEWIQEQIRQRTEARARKDFAAADHVREALAAKGILLEDRPDGSTRWKR